MILHRCTIVEQDNRCTGAWHDSGRFTEGLCAGDYPCRFAMAKPGEGKPPIEQAFLDWLRGLSTPKADE